MTGFLTEFSRKNNYKYMNCSHLYQDITCNKSGRSKKNFYGPSNLWRKLSVSGRWLFPTQTLYSMEFSNGYCKVTKHRDSRLESI